jgi:hypothetical protein
MDFIDEEVYVYLGLRSGDKSYLVVIEFIGDVGL